MPFFNGVIPIRRALIVQEILVPVTYTFSGGGGDDDLKQLPSPVKCVDYDVMSNIFHKVFSTYLAVGYPK
jgi:hypothetical protein